jgi:ferredoxin
LPEIAAERCVHALLENASCRACVDSCPRDAWLLDDDALGLDSGACDGCGLCVPACPEGALAMRQEMVIRGGPGRQYLLVACEYAESVSGEGVLSCVHSLGIQSLLSLYWKGIRRLKVATGNCDDCSRGGGGRLTDRIASVNRSLKSAGCPGIELDRLATDEFRQLLNEPAGFPSGADVTRRGFLRGFTRAGLRQAGELALSSGAAERAFTPPGALLPDLPGQTLWPWQPVLDAARCNGCDACARLCPHQAIVLEQTEAGIGYRLNPQNCTGCGICRDVCDRGAVRLQQWQPQRRQLLALQQARCSACGAGFHLPREQPLPERGKCRICVQHNHQSNLFQVLD